MARPATPTRPNSDREPRLSHTMDELMTRASGDSRFRTFVLGSFGVLGLALALVGVYGVMAYTVSQRLHELGIRAALGAQRSDLLTLVLKDAGLMTVIGVAIGMTGAMFATRLTGTLLFGISPRDPATFAVVAGLLTLAALAASWLPARKAARVEPMTVMRG